MNQLESELVNLREFYKRRLKRVSEQVEAIKERHGPNPNDNFTYWGGREIGLFEAKQSVYEDIIDDINSILKV